MEYVALGKERNPFASVTFLFLRGKSLGSKSCGEARGRESCSTTGPGKHQRVPSSPTKAGLLASPTDSGGGRDTRATLRPILRAHCCVC